MSGKTKRRVPKLRFPEFRDDPGWEEIRLGKVAVIVRGGSPRPIDSYLTPDENGLNWLKIGDVDQEEKYVIKTKEKVIPAALTKTRVVRPGDLIMSNSMSFGRPYIMNIESCIHDGWLAITNLNDSANKDYIYYLILSPSSQNYFLRNAAGSGVKNLNADMIKDLPILLPRPNEQQKIADCLSSVDALIGLQGRKVEQLARHKQALLQQLFPADGDDCMDAGGRATQDAKAETTPRLRFPEYRTAPAWEEKKISELLTIGSGRDYKHLSDGNYPVYGTGGYMLSVSEYLYDGESVCIGRKGTIDSPFFLTGKFWTVDTLFYTHSFVDCIPIFIFLWFQKIDWKRYNEASGVPSLSKNTIGTIKLFIPAIEEQQKIANCLSSLDTLIDRHRRKLAALKRHKQGLMQQLFPAGEEA